MISMNEYPEVPNNWSAAANVEVHYYSLAPNVLQASPEKPCFDFKTYLCGVCYVMWVLLLWGSGFAAKLMSRASVSLSQ